MLAMLHAPIDVVKNDGAAAFDAQGSRFPESFSNVNPSWRKEAQKSQINFVFCALPPSIARLVFWRK